MRGVAGHLEEVVERLPVLSEARVPSSMNQRGLSRSAHMVGWPPMQYQHLPHEGM